MQGQVELRLAGITLTSRTSAKLIVDTTRFVAFGGEHVQTAQPHHFIVFGLDRSVCCCDCLRPSSLIGLCIFNGGKPALSESGSGHVFRIAAQHDVGASTCHVGGNSHRTLATGLRNDCGLSLVLLGVKHLMWNTILFEQTGDVFRLFDTRGANQNRLTRGVAFGDVFDDCPVLGFLGTKHKVRLIDAHHGTVRRNGHHPEAIDLVELGSLCHGRTGHAAELFVKPEKILQGNRCQGLILGFDFHAFFGLNRLVQSFVVTTPFEDSTRVFVDDDDLAIHHHIVTILLEQILSANRVVQESHEWGIHCVVKIVDAELVFDLVDGALKYTNRALLLINLVVGISREHARQAGELAVPRIGLIGRAADDERGTCLVDQNGVDFVDHSKVVASLNQLILRPRHVVAKVIETELVVCAVGDVAGICSATLNGRHARENAANAHAEKAVDATHPLGVTLGEVIVHSDDMDALAGNGIQVSRESCHKGLAFTCAHLGDIA